MFKVVVGTRNI